MINKATHLRTNLPLLFAASLALVACGGPGKPAQTPATAAASPDVEADPATTYAPLEVGADYQNYHKVTKAAHTSKTHGGRLVEIWVNDLGYQAYIDEAAELPVGTIVVKTSWEAADGHKTDVAGPLFVMQKREPGYSPEHGDWYYAMHWEQVPQHWQKRLGTAQLYWRSPSAKVDYCWKCHDNYPRELGMPAVEARAWTAD